MVPRSKCKPSLCVVDIEIKSCYTRHGGNLVPKVTGLWTMGEIILRVTPAVVSSFKGLHPGQIHPSALDFIILKVNKLN